MFLKQITLVPVNTLPIEEATPQVEDILKNEEAQPIVEAEITNVEPEIIEIKEEMGKVDEAEFKPEKLKKQKRRNVK